MNDIKKRELTSAEARGYPAVVELKNRISAIENLIRNYATRGLPFPPGLRGKLIELQNLKASLYRIEDRIADGERAKTFINPIRTENKKRSLLG